MPAKKPRQQNTAEDTASTAEAPESVEAAAKDREPRKPYASCARFKLDKSIKQAQLHDELNQALGSRVEISVSGLNRTQGAGDVLWVVPESVNRKTVQRVLDEHVPDPNWGVSPSARAYREVAAKVAADPNADLTNAEMKVAVRELILQLQTMTGPPNPM